MQTDLLERRVAAARPASWNADARTIEAVVASNQPVARRDASGPFDEILDVRGADLAALIGAPVLDAHRQDGVRSIIGTVESARVEGNEIVAVLRMSARAELADLVRDIGDGILRNLSAGYIVAEWRDGIDPVSKRRTKTATSWTPKEISFVPLGADPAAKTRNLKMTIDTSADDRPNINRAIRDLARRSGAATSLSDDLIDRAANIDEAREAILDDMLARGRVSITTARHNANTLDNPEALIRAAGEALYCRVDPNHKPDDAARQFIGLSLPELARDLLRRAGVATTGMSADTVITRAMHSTSDFPLILADTVGRTMRVAYTAAPSGVRQLARQTTVPDFRKKSRLQLDALGLKLELVGETGEFKSGTMAEAGESYAADSYGKTFAISRKAIVNDDLGAFTDLSRRLGQAAVNFEADFLVNMVVANAGDGPVMSDTKNLFDADHGNLAGTGAAPRETTLGDARLAMRRQTGPGGALISVTPKYLLVPPDLETVSEKLVTAIQAVQIDNVNTFAWLTLVVEPRLIDPKRWYVVADPAEIDGLEYCFLAGAPGPQVESRAGFHVDGVEIKVREDFGAGFVDWRGWYTNAGA